MKISGMAAILSILFILLPSNVCANGGAKGLNSREDDKFRKATCVLDFSDYSVGSIDEWLKAKGFRLESGAKNSESIEFQVNGDSLIIEAKKRTRGFLFNESLDLKEFSIIRIRWGVIKYPEDASYERKVHNEALMLYVFFGHDKIPSGHFALPASPYFIGLFLGKADVLNKPHKGRFYHQGGRFVCVGNPEPNETVVTDFDLRTAFQRYFRKGEVPVVSGICLGVDTSSSGDGGKAAAFIKGIEFLE